jgi:crossover junction endodeoxyribonuclease RuvC
MLVLGIDPGSRVLGYGLIDWSAAPSFVLGGTIEAREKDPPGARVLELGRELETLLREVVRGHRVQRAGIENGFVGGFNTDLMLANARGVALYIVKLVLGLEPTFINPSTVKKAAAGHGRADKEAVQVAVQRTLRMRSKPSPDTADALAVAIATAGAA